MSDVLSELAEVAGAIDRYATRAGVIGEPLRPLVARLWDALTEVREREERATRELDKCNCNRED